MNKLRLFRKTKGGSVSVWSIWSEGDKILIETRQSEFASPILFKEDVPIGKAGRSIETQIQLRINSRVKNKLDHGFCPTKEEAMSGELKNQMGLLLPMLAEPYKKVKNIEPTEAFIQHKLNGHRCLITRVGSEYIAYSRGGEQIHTIDHIVDALDFPDGYTLDGELYCHGFSLQTISSWIRRQQSNTLKIKFIIYDVITPYDDSYLDRYKFLRSGEVKFGNTNSGLLKTTDGAGLGDKYSLMELLQSALDLKFEGLILRPKTGLYAPGRRVKDLIKVKKFADDEFTCIAISKSKSGLAMVHCLSKSGEEFKVTAPGNRAAKDFVLQYPEKFKGRKLTVEYAELTDKGVPFHAVAAPNGWNDPL